MVSQECTRRAPYNHLHFLRAEMYKSYRDRDRGTIVIFFGARSASKYSRQATCSASRARAESSARSVMSNIVNERESTMKFTYADLAGMIDHSLLQQTLTDAELDQGCQLAREYQVRRCASSRTMSRGRRHSWPGRRSRSAPPSASRTAAMSPPSRSPRPPRPIADGARELDMVVNIGKVLSKDWAYVTDDITPIVDLAHQHGAIVKVIFENCFLQDEHKERLCRICGEVRADFVKTSTGYGSAGAIDEDLKLMRRCSPPHVQVKAAGGVRTFEKLLAVRALGVTRVGATATRVILDDCKKALAEGRGG